MSHPDTSANVRVAVDIGGTFTDLHLFDNRNRKAWVWKTPSTPDDLSRGLINGLNGITQLAGIPLSDIDMILHGSTIATNAVLERKLPKGALITTAGFRDVLEIGRHMRSDVYTLKAESRPLLIPREYRFTVDERIKSDGTVLRKLSANAISGLARELLAQGIETVAVVFLHGHLNPQHEQQAATLLAEAAPSITVSTSFETSPEVREFERTSTTVLNALLKPVISSYLERVEERLQNAGVNAQLYLVQSNGGLTSPKDAATLPVRLLLSGPAGGATAMAILAKQHGIKNLIGLDVGGTSSDISLVSDGRVDESQESSIDGLPIRMPMIEIRTIGAGGGSIARVETGALRVGPESAGAAPGPVCYARGGKQVTVTDANAVIGLIDDKAFRTGDITLDIDAARQCLSDNLCEPLNLDQDHAANGILDIANSHMAGAIRLSLFEKGADPADFSLAPFGGAAGLHACAVAEELGIKTIIFPAHASTLSALGILLADIRHDLSISKLLPADPASLPELKSVLARLANQADDTVQQNGLTPDNSRVSYSCDMRYRGQAFELTTPWPEVDTVMSKDTGLVQPNSLSSLDDNCLQAVINNFHRIHEERFTFTAVNDPIEIVALRARISGKIESGFGKGESHNTEDMPNTVADADACKTLTIAGSERSLSVETREKFLHTNNQKDGPFLIQEQYTVLLIADGWQAKPLTNGDIQCSYTGRVT